MDYELLESAPDAFLIADDQGRIVFVNALNEQLFGYAPGELVGTSLDSLVPERYRLAHNHLGQYVAPTQPRVMGVGLELSARRKDGTEFAVEISSSPLQSPAGPRFISTIRDVTGRKMAEAERDRLTAE